MIYQLMFAIITPALISGAFAERMKFSAMLLFTTLWSLFVYFPMAHMVWGKGGLLNAFLGGKFPCFDFAGGTVVHITSGVSALVCALYLGKRLGLSASHEAAQPGAELHRRLPAVGGLVRIQCRQRAGCLQPGHQRVRGHAFRRRGRRARLDARGVDSLRQAQRARRHLRRRGRAGRHHAGFRLRPAVSPRCHRFRGRHSLLFHGGQGQNMFGYDDSLDAFGVHGCGGTLGALLTGVFATSAINSGLKDSGGHVLPLGLVDGKASQVLNQC
jgi:ammonium transporter, Amt family